MPDYVKNKIIMKEIRQKPIFDQDENIDFNKIIPMPESLSMESGTKEQRAIEIYLSMKKNNIKGYRNDLSKKEINEIVNLYGDNLEQIMDLGEKYIMNLQQYGATTWYGWCTQNWGTKWNSVENTILDENTITFQTAWNTPNNIIKKLSEMYPREQITLKYAGEDIGYNVGEMIYCDGKCIKEKDIVEKSHEAYEIYVELWDDFKCLKKDEKGNWEHKNCEECSECC